MLVAHYRQTGSINWNKFISSTLINKNNSPVVVVNIVVSMMGLLGDGGKCLKVFTIKLSYKKTELI